MEHRHALAAAAALGLALLPVAACTTDPVHATAVQNLGPEAANIPQGQYHRAGQPCTVCHGPEGPASTQFSIAGTIFYGPGLSSPPVGVGNATVYLEDDSQARFQATTNCVGNFWVKTSDWQPQFPVLVTVQGQGQTVSMNTHIGRESSCAGCHAYPTNLDYFQTPGLISLLPKDDPTFKGDPSCPVQPPVPVGLGGP